jgi:hypothetical protein
MASSVQCSLADDACGLESGPALPRVRGLSSPGFFEGKVRAGDERERLRPTTIHHTSISEAKVITPGDPTP